MKKLFINECNKPQSDLTLDCVLLIAHRGRQIHVWRAAVKQANPTLFTQRHELPIPLSLGVV